MSIREIPPNLNTPDPSKLPGQQHHTVKSKDQNHHNDSFVKSNPIDLDVYNNLGKMKEIHRYQGTLLDTFLSLRESVDNQLNALLNSFSQTEGNTNLAGKTKDELNDYFTENPEALEQIANGKIPEYWNVENTAGRMFNIVTAGVTEETNRESFYTKALDFVNRAYDEVQEMIGFDFPPLVQQTKEALLNGLEQYKEGADIQDIIFA